MTSLSDAPTVPARRPHRPADDAGARAVGPVQFTGTTSVNLGAAPGHTALVMGLAVAGPYVLATHHLAPVGVPHGSVDPGTLVLRDRDDLSLVASIEVGSQPRKVAVHPGRNKAYVVNYGQKSYSVSIVDLTAQQVVATVAIGPGPIDVAVDPVADRAYVTNMSARRIEVIDGATDAKLAPIPLGAPNRTPNGIDVDPATGTVYAAVSFGDPLVAPRLSAVAVVDGPAGTVRAMIEVPPAGLNQPHDVAFVPAGPGTPARLAVGCLGRPGVPPSVVVVPLDGSPQLVAPTNSNVSAVAADVPVGLAFTATANGVHAIDLAAGTVVGTAAAVKGSIGVAVGDDGVVYVGHTSDGTLTRLETDVVRPAPPSAPPLAISSTGGRHNLFRQRADGEIETSSWGDRTDWSRWQRTGHAFPADTPIAAHARQAGRWDLFAVDGTGQLWGCRGQDQWVDAMGWQPMGPPELAPGGHAATVAIDGGGVLVFSVGADGVVRSASRTDAGPGNWGRHDGAAFAPGTAMAVCSRMNGHWDAFVAHEDGRVYTQWWSTDEDAPSAWAPLGGVADGGAHFLPGTPVTAMPRKGNHIDLYAVGADGQARTCWWSRDEQWWHGWGVIPGATFHPDTRIAPLARQADVLDIVAVDTAGTVQHAWWFSDPGWSGWTARPLTSTSPRGAVVIAARGPDDMDIVWATTPAGATDPQTTTAWFNPYDGWSFDRGITHVVRTPMVSFFERKENDEEVDGQLMAKFWNTGTYSFRGHVHGGAIDPFAFVYRALVVPAGGAVAFPHYHEGDVDGWDPFGDDEGRNADWGELGVDAAIASTWADVRNGRMIMSETHDNVGFGGVFEDVVNWFVDSFLVSYITQNPQLGYLGAVIALGGALAEAFGISGPPAVAELSGVIVVGGMLFVQAPGLLLPAAVAGIVTALGVRHRELREDELTFAEFVFGATLPPRDKIRLTNLSGLAGKPFVAKAPDGTYLVNLASDACLDDPIGYVDPDEPNDRPGRLLIHELVHVWDVHRASSSFRWISEAGPDALFGDGEIPGPNEDFEGLSPEHKAAAVAEAWYTTYIDIDANGRPIPQSLLDDDALTDDYYLNYIQPHILNPQDEEDS